MSDVSLKQLKQAEKSAQQQQALIGDFKNLVKDIERCEHTINSLTNELAGINEQHKERRTTREDIAYLEALLACAKRKLAWEKQIASLQKRTPPLLATMTTMMNDANTVMTEETKNNLLASLQALQAAMKRLQSIQIK